MECLNRTMGLIRIFFRFERLVRRWTELEAHGDRVTLPFAITECNRLAQQICYQRSRRCRTQQSFASNNSFGVGLSSKQDVESCRWTSVTQCMNRVRLMLHPQCTRACIQTCSAFSAATCKIAQDYHNVAPIQYCCIAFFCREHGSHSLNLS